MFDYTGSSSSLPMPTSLTPTAPTSLLERYAQITFTSRTSLIPGIVWQKLCLGFAGQDCEITHVVVSGDSCLSIAQATNTTLDIILANNPNVNNACSNIHPGEVRLPCLGHAHKCLSNHHDHGLLQVLCTANSVIVKNSTSL